MYTHHKQTIAHPSDPFLYVEFCALEESQDYTAHFSDTRDIRHVRGELNKGNNAAWFCAQVYVRIKGTDVVSKSQYLGCCSYPSFEAFIKEEQGYFRDMVNDATMSLEDNLDLEISKVEGALKTLKAMADKRK